MRPTDDFTGLTILKLEHTVGVKTVYIIDPCHQHIFTIDPRHAPKVNAQARKHPRRVGLHHMSIAEPETVGMGCSRVDDQCQKTRKRHLLLCIDFGSCEIELVDVMVHG